MRKLKNSCKIPFTFVQTVYVEYFSSVFRQAHATLLIYQNYTSLIVLIILISVRNVVLSNSLRDQIISLEL